MSTELYGLIGVVIANAALVLIAYIKLNADTVKRATEIKIHTDVTVQKLNGMLSYVAHSFDRPMWIKMAYEEHGCVVFRMLEMNHLYGEIYGIKRSDYLGKTDFEAGWKKDEADRFWKNDLLVWSSGEPSTFEEDCHGELRTFRKIRITTPDGAVKGVLGYQVNPLPPLTKMIIKE